MKRSLLSNFSVLGFATAIAAQCPEPQLGAPLGVGDDTVFAIRSIGFAFPFAGTTYSDVHVCTNGYFFLSNASVPAPGGADFSPTEAEFVAGAPRIAPMWNDLDIRADNNGQVFIDSTASKCTITWKNAQNYNAATGGGALFDMQAQLFPTGEVRFFYTPNTSNNSSIAAGQTAVVGCTPGGGATLPLSVDLSATGVTGDNTTHQFFATANTFDLANDSLVMLPLSPGWTFLPLGAPVNCASTLDYGTGCVQQADSFYELFATGATVDLGGRTLTMLRQGQGYIVLDSIPGTYVPPGPTATIVANADDVTQTVALSVPMPFPGGPSSQLTISSNGNVSPAAAPGNTNLIAPTVAQFLAMANTAIAPAWHDHNPAATGSGKIYFEEIAGIAYVSWDNVYTYNTTTPSQFQLQLNLATGDITIVYVTLAAAGGQYIAGFSVAGASPNPGSMNLSLPFVAPLTVADSASGVRLTTSGAPFLGNAGFEWRASSVPTLAPVAFLLLGDTVVNPGLDLTFLGMPTCSAYTNGNLFLGSFPLTPFGAGTVPFPIPNSPGSVGLTLSSQVVALSLLTPGNLVASNGNVVTIGN